MRTVTTLTLVSAMLAAAVPAWAAKTMPKFYLQDVDGKKRAFEDVAAQYELVAFVFWGTGCAPCKEQLIETNKLLDEYKGLGLVAVSTDTARTSSQVKSYIKGQGYEFETLLDVDGDLQRGLGIPGIPYSLLVASDGDIVWEHSGYRRGDERKMKEEIDKFFAEREKKPAPDEDVTQEG
ncbi:MAG: redoxin domain-containing protein [candidate division Zixibacteria bacterium]|nr:redoxin domain-containing protein [candidate division Zixibacteria bacterium]